MLWLPLSFCDFSHNSKMTEIFNWIEKALRKWETCWVENLFQRKSPVTDRVSIPPGNSGKMRLLLENLELSWNFEKINKNHGKWYEPGKTGWALKILPWPTDLEAPVNNLWLFLYKNLFVFIVSNSSSLALLSLNIIFKIFYYVYVYLYIVFIQAMKHGCL